MALRNQNRISALGLVALMGAAPFFLGTQSLGQTPAPSSAPGGSPTAPPAASPTPSTTTPSTTPPSTTAPLNAPSSSAVKPLGRDADAVEKVLASRREYQRSLEALRLYYLQANQQDKAKWAQDELIQYHRIAKQPYILELDVPPVSLGTMATQNSPDANELYRRALTYKDRGWGTDYVDNQRRAEILLQQVLTAHPTSNRISDTAYQLGELYEGKAYKQFHRAALYYDRSVQWNPQQAEGRMRAAKLYEQYNIDRNRATELFREVISHDTDQRRVEEAKQRLEYLARNK